MMDDLKKAQNAINSWYLGQTSERYETGGRGVGTISTGRGDRGGVSYGAYQLSSKMGTLQEYLDQSSYKNEFKGLTPATAEFNAKWRSLAKADPEFAKDQHDFIKRTHVDVQDDKLKAKGIDLSGRGKAVQDALWSTSVQFRDLTPVIFSKGLQEKFGKDYKLSDLSDKNIIEAIQDYKIAHNNTLFSKSPALWPGLLDRARNEKTDLVRLAGYEEVVKNNIEEKQSQIPAPQGQPFGSLKQVTQTSLLSNPSHSDYPLYVQALRGIEKLPINSFDNDQERQNAAATMAFQAKANGLKQIDSVLLNTTNTGLFAVQGRLDDPAHHRIYLDKVQAAAQPIEASTEQMNRETQQPQYQQQPQPMREPRLSV